MSPQALSPVLLLSWMHDTVWISTWCSEKEDLDGMHGGGELPRESKNEKAVSEDRPAVLPSSGYTHKNCLSQLKKGLILLHTTEDKISSCSVPALMLME